MKISNFNHIYFSKFWLFYFFILSHTPHWSISLTIRHRGSNSDSQFIKMRLEWSEKCLSINNQQYPPSNEISYLILITLISHRKWHTNGHPDYVPSDSFKDSLIGVRVHFYPRPVFAFGYCRCLRMCVCVCPCVRTIIHQPFKLGSPNWDQRCKIPWWRSLLFCGAIDLDLQGQIELKSQNLPHFEHISLSAR